MKYIKSIVPILVQNFYIFGCNCGDKCCPKKVLNENRTEIDTSNNGEDKKIEEETLKKHQEENLKKINNVKEQGEKIKNDDEIREEIKNEKKITIEPPKGDKFYADIIEKIQKDVDEAKKKEETKEIPEVIGKLKKLNEDFTESPMNGLENIGATCYMNATLQCFANIKKFVEYFKYDNNDSFTKKNTLSYSFKEVIDNLWNKNTKKSYYVPSNFKEKISTMNSLFEGIAANDAKDLINFLIMKLHDELNKVENPVNVVDTNLSQDQTNQFLMLKNFAENFMKTNQSIISDLFYAMNCNITQCGCCNTCSYNYQTYFFLIFPLEEVRKHNLNECKKVFLSNRQNYYNNACYYNLIKHQNAINNKVDIFDCFNYECKLNTMSGANAMYCNYCKQTTNSYIWSNLTYGPEILIIILNRGIGIQFKVNLNFSEDLNLANYIYLKNTGTQYKLKGVITHMGGNDMSGHFIAFCKDPITNKWYKFNDATVTPVNDFKSEVIDYAMPYVLFYEKIK